MPSRDELRDHLIRTRIAGDVATSRENNLDHYRLLAERDPYLMLGLTLSEPWPFRDILALMAKAAGVVPDPEHLTGQDTIDPERVLDALDEMAEVIAGALAVPGARVLLATGHPAGLLPVHLALGRLAVAHGATLLEPAEGFEHVNPYFGRRRSIRYLEGVAILSDKGAFVHSHEAEPMRAMLAELGDDRPDLVIADHGWAGAAGEAGLLTVGFADSNDPALFVGEAEGKLAAVVPLDDHVLPRYYAPLADYLVTQVTRALGA
ncbi:Phosphatase [Sinosporangium album]|uniref:Phosphatase n=1 Tax=Sinosporangium album TaxID=504805 RepID=A0A1G7U800_9ACTN|nr:phosphatase [Sinosporangium album]SDG43534.1 Phosphatase [Sinosporangium album]